MSGGPRDDRGPTGHRRRRAARRMAIDILYQADVTERPPGEVMRQWRAAGRAIPLYTEELVGGVERDRAGLDRLLGTHAEGWTVPRMAVVDRTILRGACYEMSAGGPPAGAINEAGGAADGPSAAKPARGLNGGAGRDAPGNGPGSGLLAAWSL